MQSTDPLSEIAKLAALHGLAPSTFCERAAGNSKLPKRLADGGSVTLATMEKLRSWQPEQAA